MSDCSDDPDGTPATAYLLGVLRGAWILLKALANLFVLVVDVIYRSIWSLLQDTSGCVDTKSSKHKEKKKLKKVLTLDEFCDSQAVGNLATLDNEDALRMHRLRESKRIAEEAYCDQESGCNIDPVKHMNESLFSASGDNSTVVSEGFDIMLNSQVPARRSLSELKEDIYTQIESLILEKGAMDMKDPFLLSKMEKLPEESKRIIADCGGFVKFIQQDVRFAIVGETLCLFKDMTKIYNSRQKLNQLDEFGANEGECESSKDLTVLNPNANVYSPSRSTNDLNQSENFAEKTMTVSKFSPPADRSFVISNLRQHLSSFSDVNVDNDLSSVESFHSDENLHLKEMKSVDDDKVIASLKMLLASNLSQDVSACLHEALKKVVRNTHKAQKIMDSVKTTPLIVAMDKIVQVGYPVLSLESKHVMTEMSGGDTDIQINALVAQVSELKEQKQQVEENFADALDANRKLQNKLNVEVPDLSKRLQEAEEENEKENRLLRSKIMQLEKEIKQWRQKHDQAIDNLKESEKDATRYQAKWNSLSSKVKSLEDEVYAKEQETEKQSDMIIAYEKLVKGKEKLAAEADNRAKKAEIGLLSSKKTGILEKLDTNIKASEQKLSELQDGLLKSGNGLPPIFLTGLEAYIKKLKEHLKILYSLRVDSVKKIEDQILQLESGNHLSNLDELILPAIPTLPSMDEMMPKMQPAGPPPPMMYPGQNAAAAQFSNAYQHNYPNQVPNMNIPIGQRFPMNQNAYANAYAGANAYYNPAMGSGQVPMDSMRTNYNNQNLMNSYARQSLVSNPIFPSHPSVTQPSQSSSAAFPPGLSNNGMGSTMPSLPLSNFTVNTNGNHSGISGSPKEMTSTDEAMSSSQKPSISTTRSVSPSTASMADDDAFTEGSVKSAASSLNRNMLSVKSTGSCNDDVKHKAGVVSAVSRVKTPRKLPTSQEFGMTQNDLTSEEMRPPSPAASLGAASSVTSLGTKHSDTSAKPRKSYAKLLERLKEKYPDMAEAEILDYIKEYRRMKTRFSGMQMDTLVNGVAELISKSAMSKIFRPKPLPKVLSNRPLVSTPPLSQDPTEVKVSECPWNKPASPVPTSWDGESAEENCVICYELLTPANTKKVNCGHSYHLKCIKQWMEYDSTCTICRKYIVLDEDFPALK